MVMGLKNKLKVHRRSQKIQRDPNRVICRPHIPGKDPERVARIIRRVLRLPNEKAAALYRDILGDFSDRHKNITNIFEQHFQQVCTYVPAQVYRKIEPDRQRLIGAYFTMEYSIESAALFNPSIVPHPDQHGLPEGSLRYIMSLRAVGEGHISSIVFRSGIIDRRGKLRFDPVSRFVDKPELRLNPVYKRELFRMKLLEIGGCNEVTDYVLDRLPQEFSYEQLKEQMALLFVHPVFDPGRQMGCFKNMDWLVNSNYRMDFRRDHEISERVIFPVSEVESEGIEDARFVQFRDDDGQVTYYATYTAYDGKRIMPQLIETPDFLHFRISTLYGRAVQNKGMALFPRKINGRYAMLSRQDGENNYIMFSDKLPFWKYSRLIQEPNEPWEFIQIGNCGSPLETGEGWLVLTHGVGPMRVYSIGAVLLDLNDPSRMIARLKKPLLQPREGEREGYVPNVVYTCGALLHKGRLIIPYAMSDMQAGIATVTLDELLGAMQAV